MIFDLFRLKFPKKLPQPKLDLDAFCDQVIELAGVPNTLNNQHAVAAMIMHLDPTTDSKPIEFFVKSLKKSIANEMAYHKIQECKKLELERLEKEKAAQDEGKTDAPAEPN